MVTEQDYVRILKVPLNDVVGLVEQVVYWDKEPVI